MHSRPQPEGGSGAQGAARSVDTGGPTAHAGRGVWAIVVAGGNGSRFGGPKQFAHVGGRPLVEWSLEAAASCVDGVVLVVPEDQLDTAPRFDRTGADVVVAGGPTRAASVRAGLAAVPDAAAVVVVHDAARPLASPALFRAVIGAVIDDGRVGGAIPGVPVTDTLKEVDGGVVAVTVPRDRLVAVQTPQAFRADVLRSAHAGGEEATDDAALVEQQGGTVVVVAGEPGNLKVTVERDLALVELALADAPSQVQR